MILEGNGMWSLPSRQPRESELLPMAKPQAGWWAHYVHDQQTKLAAWKKEKGL